MECRFIRNGMEMRGPCHGCMGNKWVRRYWLPVGRSADHLRRGAIDNQGQVVITPCSGQRLVFSEKLAAFSSGGKCGVMTTSGQVLVPPRYRSISYYGGGLACFELNGLYGCRGVYHLDRGDQSYEGVASTKQSQSRWSLDAHKSESNSGVPKIHIMAVGCRRSSRNE